MKFNFEPQADLAFIQVAEKETVTKGGILIPQTTAQTMNRGIIIEVGKSTVPERLKLKKGDDVIYDDRAGTPITIEGKECLIISQGSIFLKAK